MEFNNYLKLVIKLNLLIIIIIMLKINFPTKMS